MNKSSYIYFAFLLFFIPSVVYAQEETIHSLQPLDGSSYTAEFVAITKNNSGDLVSVIAGDVYAYLPHPIFENELNKYPSSIITIDGIDYKKWRVWLQKVHENEKPIHGSELTSSMLEKNVVILRAIHASIVVEKNDTTDYFMTILKKVS